MDAKNYESKWWGYIYDQMMEDLSDWVECNRYFYHESLKQIKGSILECACGTGIFFLPFLKSGFNIYGFDISASMLATLKKKANAQGISGLDERISIQDLESFRYDKQFEAIFIATNSFSHLLTQEAQIRSLRNIHSHLVPGGKLLIDLRHPGLRTLVEAPEIEEGSWYTWTHPETGLPIRQRVVGRYDVNNQLIQDRCYIEYEGQAEDFPMSGRWFYKEEFQLLLRLAGFEHWEVFGSPTREPLIEWQQSTQSYWVAMK